MNTSLPYPFTLLHESLRFWIEKRRFFEPTSIQKLAIPKILEGKNVLLISPTGTGKTEAAIFPVISKILENKSKEEGVKAIYVNPLKALTRDLRKRIDRYAHFVGLKVRPLFGDVNKAFKYPVPEMVIITPESLEIILDWAPKWWKHLKSVNFVILDEVHELAFSKRGYQLLILLERLKYFIGKSFQRICLSATVGEAEKVAWLFGGSDGPLEIISAEEQRPYDFKLKLATPLSEDEMRDPFLAGARVICEEVESGVKSLIFVNSRYSAERLKLELDRLNFPVMVHHGSLGLEEREKAEDMFKSGLLRAVIATKTLELGVDIGDIKQVLQYRSPGQVCTLLQRAGRSQHRPGEKSICKIISTDPEDFIESMAILRLAERGKLEGPLIIDNPLDVLAKEILGVALHNQRGRKFCNSSFQPVTTSELFKIISNSIPFSKISRETFDNVLGNLVNSDLICLEGNVVYPSSRFWGIWRFKEDEKVRGPSLRFSEFFSMIPKREAFTVMEECGLGKKRKIGELDSSFVYKSLSTGMVIRLAGRNWKVVDIDERSYEVIVTHVEEAGETPAWKGEGPPRSLEVTREALKVISDALKDPSILKRFCSAETALIAVLDYLKSLDESYLKSLVEGKIVVERIPGIRTTVFITFLGERINRALAAAVFEKIAEASLLVKYVVTPYGFGVRSEVVDPLNALRAISLDEFRDLVGRHLVEHSPFTRLVKDQLKEHFGFPYDERLLDKEAARQASLIYYDVEGAFDALQNIIRGALIEVVKDSPSGLAESILRYPFERPWRAGLRVVLSEVLASFKEGRLDEIFEFTWSNPVEVKNELRAISRERDLVAFFDLKSRGWTVAKVPLEDGWVTVRVPVAVKYAVLGSEEDFARVERELIRDAEEVLKDFIPCNEIIELDFTSLDEKVKYPLKLALGKVFRISLETFIKTRVFPAFGDKLNLRVHVERTRLSAFHYAVPKRLIHAIVLNSLSSMLIMPKKGIVTGRRQLIFELP